jgi:AcrR family transcriptional regulator
LKSGELVSKDLAEKNVAKRSRSAKTEETRKQVLTAALEQFAQYGFHGASMRDISAQSGVQLSGLHYHFGSKEELFSATVERVFSKLSEARLNGLEALRAQSERLSLEQILTAFIAPSIDLAASSEGPFFMMLQSRVNAEKTSLSDDLMRLVLESTKPFRDALQEAMPGVPDVTIFRGYRIMVSSLSGVPVDHLYEILTKKAALPRRKRELEALVDLLVRYHAAGFRSLENKGSSS